MPKNDNPHSLRLIESIRRHCSEEQALAFADAHPLPKSADIDKKFRWACDVCASLEAKLHADSAASIRRDCRCGDGKTMAQEISGCISRAGNLPNGCALFTQKNRYAFLEYVSEHELIFGYHACVCSCVKRVEGMLPLLWCECSVGYAEAMFRQVFGDTVQVTLLGSVKAGNERCSFHIRW